MNYQSIKLDISDTVATLALARPERKNAFDIATRGELADAVARIKADTAVRAVILTGEGGDFCAGGDIRDMAQAKIEADAGRERMRALQAWGRELIELDRPVVAAVDGVAFGAGFSLALSADIVLATPRARFCMSFMRVGLAPDLAAFYTLPRAVGVQRAKELMLSARVVEAEEAARLGIVMEIVPADELMPRARAITRSFAEASPTVVSLIKTTLGRAGTDDLNTALHLEAAAQGIAFSTEYHRQAIQDFLAKKPLRFGWPERKAGDA
jgi:2-(1,2-epoxy-1,2-dihydrophenyl)acetyl-CoA isomerase